MIIANFGAKPRLPIVTVKCEGGFYSPDRLIAAPIRIYSDRWVSDDICGLERRCRLSRKEFRNARKAAKINRIVGCV